MRKRLYRQFNFKICICIWNVIFLITSENIYEKRLAIPMDDELFQQRYYITIKMIPGNRSIFEENFCPSSSGGISNEQKLPLIYPVSAFPFARN